MLLLEDLSAAHWPPPWRPDDVRRLLAALRVMASTPVTSGSVPELERDRGRFAGWLNVERDPAPFLSLGLCTEAWLAQALPNLLVAQDLAWLGGSELVHGDLRSDNLCFLGERVVLVDWNAVRRGNAQFDLASLAPSLRLEGGPVPDELLPGEGPLAALQSGYFAANAGLRPVVDAPLVRHIQLRQLRVALPWAARAVGLPPPDLDWLERAAGRRDAALREGTIDESRWFELAEEALGDAHLASADPRLPACAPCSEAELQASDELVLEAVPVRGRPCATLLIGAASGWALDGLARVASERGLRLDADAVDPSPRLAAVARELFPERAAHVVSWPLLEPAPGRRYDLVVTTLENVPQPRRREWIEQLLARCVAPSGRVVLRPERGAGPAQRAAALGLRPAGALERAVAGHVLRGAWLAR